VELSDVKKAWNEQADEFNQWDSLDSDEKVSFALKVAKGLSATPCGECHLNPGERCDICGALEPVTGV